MVYITVIFGLVFIYGFYQFARNDKIYAIKIKWINNKEQKNDKYSYNYMFGPSKHNWYGLKFPAESDFK